MGTMEKGNTNPRESRSLTLAPQIAFAYRGGSETAEIRADSRYSFLILPL